MCKPFFRFLRYHYYRFKLKQFIRMKQREWVNRITALAHNALAETAYTLEDIQQFQQHQGLSKGEMGILLRELYWGLSPFGWQQGLITEWIAPLLSHYSETAVLALLLGDKGSSSLQQLKTLQGEKTITEVAELEHILVWQLIRDKMYLYR